MRKYEVRLYNQEVRRLLDEGERNDTGFADSWAEAYYEEVEASSPSEAKEMVSRNYPASKGFVITGVEELD